MDDLHVGPLRLHRYHEPARGLGTNVYRRRTLGRQLPRPKWPGVHRRHRQGTVRLPVLRTDYQVLESLHDLPRNRSAESVPPAKLAERILSLDQAPECPRYALTTNERGLPAPNRLGQSDFRRSGRRVSMPRRTWCLRYERRLAPEPDHCNTSAADNLDDLRET